ncbi:phosphate acyltransferase PlsX [Candidatus Phytoplasma phoenicium]|uniref:Phosphate acyltransferase n=1 Tax=Candidatus Phytoplasma phoenicium TaxID=198422 RepID=A0A0L0MIJ4_9MOLU|nr:phosphate acyltransferase PlsX [Candidatus Phytoplasma phoenicium]KND62517.1 glycerol-3-phosphate acyltransferase PlsX [Candidatus Phytoplasma phoenicium]
MIKLAIDAMGGDFAPKINILGTVKALLKEPDLYVCLYGDQFKINNILHQHFSNKLISSFKKKRMTIIHTDLCLNMDITNLREVLSTQPQHSMFLALEAVRKGEVDGVVSAGPTQALIFASYFIIKTLPYIKRIALAPLVPSLDGRRTRILLDAGANIETQPEQLLNYAICASIMAKELLCISHPKIKLFNIGIESTKGRILEKKTYHLLQQDKRILFQGNEEPQNLLSTDADILLNDGFVLNMIIKSYEGAIESTMQAFKNVLTSNFFLKIISKLFYVKKLKAMKKKMDHKEIGGAMLLGLSKIVVKAHGNSNEYAFYKAILQAKKLVQQNLIQKISQQF